MHCRKPCSILFLAAGVTISLLLIFGLSTCSLWQASKMSPEINQSDFLIQPALLTPVDTTSLAPHKTFVLWADTHYGNRQGDGAANDIAASVSWIKTLNPDFIFHIGDIVDQGKVSAFNSANIDFDDIVENTLAERIWFVVGGGHDGYFGSSGCPNCNGAKFARARELTSLWYTIKEGNNVVIFCSILQGRSGWVSDWGNGDGHFIPQDKIDWLEEQLSKWAGTENNIFVIAHTPIYHTNAKTHGWAQMDKGEWQTTSKKLLDLFDKYRVDVYIHGHVHMDPDKAYSAHREVSQGNVLIRGFREDLPNTTFIHATDICWEHGRSRRSTYPSVMYFTLIEGNDYFDLNAVRVDTNARVGITYNDSAQSLPIIRVPLSYPIANMDSSNRVDYFEQAWSVWRYSDESDMQWYRDSAGLMVERPSWIVSIWDLWEATQITGFNVSHNEAGLLHHEFYCSNSNIKRWDGPYENPSDLGICRWVKVRTIVNPYRITYIYDMKLLTAAK